MLVYTDNFKLLDNVYQKRISPVKVNITVRTSLGTTFQPKEIILVLFDQVCPKRVFRV